MKTEAPVPADLRPSYVEHIFEFHVTAVPDARNSSYRLEARSSDSEDGYVYCLYYRQDDFSLEKVTRFASPSAAEETVLESARNPFIYYERHLPVIPDFFIAGRDSAGGRHEFTVGRYRVIQDIQVQGDRARITLERPEALGSLRVTMEWSLGDPWWSFIECTENPPPGAPFEGQVVASGHLLKNSGHPLKNVPAAER